MVHFYSKKQSPSSELCLRYIVYYIYQNSVFTESHIFVAMYGLFMV